MKKIVVLLFLTIAVFCFTSCVSSKSGTQDFGIHTNLAEKDYEILGIVTMTGTVKNIMGLFTFGGKGYQDLLLEAKVLFPEADAVIDVAIDVETSVYFGIYNAVSQIYTGTVIRYL